MSELFSNKPQQQSLQIRAMERTLQKDVVRVVLDKL